MRTFFRYLHQNILSLAAFFGLCALFGVSCALYRVPVQVALYPILLGVLGGAWFFGVGYVRMLRRHRALKNIQTCADNLLGGLPRPHGVEDADYQRILHLLLEERRRSETQMLSRYADMLDYYGLWAHQIKTPIAAMRLHLADEDSELSRKLTNDLFRIEQYVEMVMLFLRLDADSTDYVIKQYDLDAIVRQAVRRYSGEFIARKLTLRYTPLHVSVLTDEKWLSFVVEQVLSNALKYTKTGGVTITLENPLTLVLSDTGIGIAAEDLPRIFEKGYTGYNGRADKKASGIGLYLCKRVCDNLGHRITATSLPDAGTQVRIDLAHTARTFD